jgi:hypothetical protein
MKRSLLGIALAAGIAVLPVVASATPAFAVNNFKAYAPCPPNGWCLQVTIPCVWNSDAVYPINDGWQVVNACDVRVWLYQTQGLSGYSTCVSPGQGYIVSRSFESEWVSLNHSAC